MKLKLRVAAAPLSAAILMASAGYATAQSQVQLYGTVDAGVGSISTLSQSTPAAPAGVINKVSGVHSGNLQTSFFGMSGTEALGNGLKAKFLIEGFLRVDTGASGRFDASPVQTADSMFSRHAFVGLEGGFGEVRLGNNDNLAWVSMLITNPMGANSVFSPVFRQLYNGGARGVSQVDTAMVNSVRYMIPKTGGFDGGVVYSADEGRGRANYALHGIYRDGPLLVSAAFQHVGHAAPPSLTTAPPGPPLPPGTNVTARDQDLTLVGAAYNFGPVRAFGQYVHIKDARLGTTDKVPNFGVTIPVGAGMIQAAYSQDKTTGTRVAKRTTASVGYVYTLSKRTDLYTFAMTDKYSVNVANVSRSAGAANSYVVGIRHRF